MIMTEQWRPIPGYPGYEASNQGHIRSHLRKGAPHVLKPSLSGISGYFYVSLRKAGKTYHKKVSRLVLLAFVGPLPDGMCACHNNGDSFDDCLINLRYDTQLENVRDIARHGRRKFTEMQIIEIRNRAANGEANRFLASEYEVSEETICDIRLGRRYEYFPGPITTARKLKKDDVKHIKNLRKEGLTLLNIARMFDVSESMISLVCSGKRMKAD